MKKKNIIIIAIVFIIGIVLGGVVFKKINLVEEKEYTIIERNDFLVYSTVKSEDFKVKGEDYIYGPYALNLTENNHLLVKILEGEKYKNIGYIKLYDNSSNSFFANWYSSNISYLTICVEDSASSNKKWYFFDDSGNLIKLNDNILSEIDSEQKELDMINKKIDESQKFDVSSEDNQENFIYISDKKYNGFNVGVTVDKEIVLYKYNNGVNKVYGKAKLSLPLEYFNDPEFVRDRGRGFHADFNNDGRRTIRLIVNEYKNGTDSEYAYILYEYDENGKFLSSTEYFYTNSLAYVSNKMINGYNFAVTTSKEFIIYKVESNQNRVYKKFNFYVDPVKLVSTQYVKEKGPGFHIDFNNDNNNTYRIKIDKYVSGTDTKYSDIWYEYDINGNLISEHEQIFDSSLLYVSNESYNGFQIGITNQKELVLFKNYNGYKHVYAKTKSYVENDKFFNSDYISKYGPGFYADFNNNNSNNIRVRVDKYINGSNVRYSYIWYEYDANGKLLTTQEYIDSSSFLYVSNRKYGKFNIAITSGNEIILYENINGVNKVYGKAKMYIDEKQLLDIEYISKEGTRFYADFNSNNSNNIRIRVDKYLSGSNSRYSYIWYEYDVNGNLLTIDEYIGR